VILVINISGPIPGVNIKDLTATLEFYAEAGTDPHTPTIYTFDTAFAYLITPTVQVDEQSRAEDTAFCGTLTAVLKQSQAKGGTGLPSDFA